AGAMPSAIWRTLPANSPTVGLIWARAILSRLMGVVSWLDCIMRHHASEDPLATLSRPARRSDRPLSPVWPRRNDPLDAQTRRPNKAGLPHVGLHRVSGDRGATRARVIRHFMAGCGVALSRRPFDPQRKAPTPNTSCSPTPLLTSSSPPSL